MEITGKSFISTTTAELNQNGTWTVQVVMKEGRKVDYGEWEEKTIEAVSTDKSIQEAYVNATSMAIDELKKQFTQNKTESLFEDIEEEIEVISNDTN
jgi:hypothetical protein